MITSVSDFLKIVEYFYPQNAIAFFRGQQSSNWEVTSSLYRQINCNLRKDDGSLDKSINWRFSHDLFSEFEKNIPIYSEYNTLKEYSLTPLDLMFIGQHYGLSTRLIDWSKNPLISLYFAVEQVTNADGYSSVYMLYDSNNQNVKLFNSKSFFKLYKTEQDIWLSIQDYLTQRQREVLAPDENDDKLEINTNDYYKIANLINEKEKKLNFNDVHNYMYFRLSKEFNFLQIKNLLMNKSLISEPSSKDKINIFKINHIIKQSLNLGDLAHISSGDIFTDDNGLCMIEPLPLNLRIKNQQGVFLFSNTINEAIHFNNLQTIDNTQKLESLDKNSGAIKILIPNEKAKSILNELRYYGITEDFIYPELSSYTRRMQKDLLLKYKIEIKKYQIE